MPGINQTKKRRYGEKKKRYMMALTESASDALNQISSRLGLSRSEVLERAIRTGGLESLVRGSGS